MYLSIPELSRNRENLLMSSLQASSACVAAAERMTQLMVECSAATLATQQRLLQKSPVPEPERMLAEHQANWINWFQEACGIACETQVQLLSAMETRMHGVDGIASTALRREMETLPKASEPLLAGASAAVACLDQAVGLVTEGAVQALNEVESAVAAMETPVPAPDPETEGGTTD